MSINRRYNVERRNVNNRTFTNNNNNNRRHGNGLSTSSIDTSPTRPSNRSRYYGRDAQRGMESKPKDSPRSNPRYQVVPELDETSMEDELPFDKAGNSDNARMWDSKRDRNRDEVDDSFGDEKYDTVDDVDEEGQSDGMKDGDLDDTDDVSYRPEKLFMTEEEMLQQSAAELQATIEELEKRYDSIEDEGNEWKTRFETQQEMNQQMERQIILLQNKVEDARRDVREANKTPRESKNFDDLSDANPQMIRALERERHLLANQLRDLEWRMDQESKAYHKANDERKQYVLEINAARTTISEMKTRQKVMMMVPEQDGSSTARTYRDPAGNIPSDQRIIDPKRGPIRKTAGVKNLPSLEPEY